MQTWTILYTWETWQEFLNAGGTITGFPERRWSTVQKIRPGDLLLCYLLGISRYVGILEVTGKPFKGYKPIWSDRVYPARVPVHVRLALLPEYGVPVHALADQLSFFQDLPHPRAWTSHFRSAPIQETLDDADLIITALENASEDPVFREFDPDRLQITAPIYETAAGIVTVPEDAQPYTPEDYSEDQEDAVTHEEIQWRLLTLGSEMGLDVWVARNDRGRAYQDEAFAEIPNLLEVLPRQFDDATNRTIEHIDVLWLKNNAILAAFEIEHTSSIYSGLLRMADLVVMQPNLNIQLYIVAPDIRREKVISEVNRPVFCNLKQPLNRICHYIPYSALKSRFEQAKNFLRYLKPEFLDEIAESLEID